MCYLKMWKSPLDEAKTNIELRENYKWLSPKSPMVIAFI